MNKKKTILDMDRLSTDGYKKVDKLPLVVVLDNIRSLHNIGSIFRTCDAFRIENIHLCGITATPPLAEIHKTALGAENSVDWTYHESAKECITMLISSGYVVIAVEQAVDSVILDKLELDENKKYAIIMGNEVKGVQQELVDAADFCVEIPQFGTKHSLNVSVSAGMVIWQCFTLLDFKK